MSDIVIPKGPFETEPRARYINKDTAQQLITDALTAAGVELGAYDRRIVAWQAGWDSSSIVPLVSWLRRTAAEHKRLRKSRDAFRDQRNAVFQTNERLLAELQASDQARLLAENETRSVRREADALRARVAELEAELRIGAPWKCPVCSKENTRDVCVICETDRPEADEEPAPSADGITRRIVPVRRALIAHTPRRRPSSRARTGRARVATVPDSTLLTQATTGLTNVAQANTDTAPSGAKLYPRILAGASGVKSNLLAMGRPTHAVMHSRRWYWLSSQMSATWPMINWTNLPAEGGIAGVANAGSSYNSGPRGVLPCGLEVIVDNTIATNLGTGTNEDELYVVPASECHLWEDPDAPLFIRAEQPAVASLGVLLVAYSYFAYTFGRYAGGMQKVSGTGLATPTFA
ncbi:hypothetical protein ACWD5R_08030 [Streptomyces sp. NPDC002514]|uniref:hypothetical protein n=1 Tax=Streptomyces sp. NPDC001270 TaxID=3364554 RepID=UPI003686C6F6